MPLEKVANEQLVRAVIRFMEDRPEVQHEPLELLTVLAVRDAWPCAGQQPSE
jgi:hypothetical protein